MLEPDLSHIVFVHYLEVEPIIRNVSGIRESEEVAGSFHNDGPTLNQPYQQHEENEDRNDPGGRKIDHVVPVLVDPWHDEKDNDSFSGWDEGVLKYVEDLQMQSNCRSPWRPSELGNVAEALWLGPSVSQDQLFSIVEKDNDFSLRWADRELGDIEDLLRQSTYRLLWSPFELENVADEPCLGPSISQDQLFSIIDFSPKWAYGGSKIQVLVMGNFLKNRQEVAKCNWSCMFGEVEVPTIVLADGFLSCQAPDHDIGRVPFYVTCSNRQACSEVREFDFRSGSTRGVDIKDIYGPDKIHLHLELERLLSFHHISHPDDSSKGLVEKQKIIEKIIALKEEEDSRGVLEPSSDGDVLQHEMEVLLLQKVLREKLYSWFLHKVIDDGKGACVMDDQRQGVLPLAAALGYDWAIKPVVDAGVRCSRTALDWAAIFRDANGGTALDWAPC